MSLLLAYAAWVKPSGWRDGTHVGCLILNLVAAAVPAEKVRAFLLAGVCAMIALLEWSAPAWYYPEEREQTASSAMSSSGMKKRKRPRNKRA
jgi:hypothetical protein